MTEVRKTPGTITLARHGEPALSRKLKLSPSGYGKFWEKYEVGGLLEGQTAPEHLMQWAREADVVFVSTRLRAQQSARILLGDKPKARVIEDGRLIEAPLPPPPWPEFVKMTPKLWGFWARFWWWWFNYFPVGVESRDEARARGRAALVDITREAEAGNNVLVVAHGFFNSMVGLDLPKMGWKKVSGSGWKYWSTRRYVRRT